LALDFENDSRTGKDFFAVGLGGRTYGIIWPDRKIQPEIFQIKKSGQPVKIEAVDVKNGLVEITNRHQFKNLNELDGMWEMTVNGDTIQRGFFQVDCAPGERITDTIPFRMPKIEADSECLLTVVFLLKEDTRWANAGHEIAWEQFRIPAEVYVREPVQVDAKVTVRENSGNIIVSGKSFRYTMDKKTGKLTSLQFNETEYLESGPDFNVWRAPLANDIDPWGSYMFEQGKMTPGFGRSIDNQLRTLGLQNPVSEVHELRVKQISENEVVIQLGAFSNSSIDPSKRGYEWFFSSGFERNETWKFKADGTIELEQEIIPHGPMPDMLQKIGLQFQLPKAFSNVEWYGRGPFENYPDRKTGAKVGLYRSSAEKMYEPYLIPQEYGNRSDVRWLKVQDEKGKGLFIRGDNLLNFSLHKYTTDNLERAMYTYQLEEAPHTILNLDYEVSGVGGTANRQLQKYRVMPGVKKYSLTLKPF